jgi:cytochrome c oxidase subunit IV
MSKLEKLYLVIGIHLGILSTLCMFLALLVGLADLPRWALIIFMILGGGGLLACNWALQQFVNESDDEK